MKFVDYLYFNIYNHFYRVSQYRQSFNPRLQAMYLCSLGLGGWLLLLESVYLRMVKRAWFSSREGSMIFSMAVYLLSAALFNYIFIEKDRDLKIFGKYEARANRHPNRKWHLLFSVAILLLPYLVFIFNIIFFPRQR